MFAWSEEPGHKWPFNFHFVCDLLGIMTALMYWESTMLHKSLDAIKKDESKDEPSQGALLHSSNE